MPSEFGVDESSYLRLLFTYVLVLLESRSYTRLLPPLRPTQNPRVLAANVPSTTTGLGFSRASEPSRVQIIALRVREKHYGSASGRLSASVILTAGDLEIARHDTRRPYKRKSTLPHQWVCGLKSTERCLLEFKLEREPT